MVDRIHYDFQPETVLFERACIPRPFSERIQYSLHIRSISMYLLRYGPDMYRCDRRAVIGPQVARRTRLDGVSAYSGVIRADWDKSKVRMCVSGGGRDTSLPMRGL